VHLRKNRTDEKKRNPLCWEKELQNRKNRAPRKSIPEWKGNAEWKGLAQKKLSHLWEKKMCIPPACLLHYTFLKQKRFISSYELHCTEIQIN
jgi:hypothetical protein